MKKKWWVMLILVLLLPLLAAASLSVGSQGSQVSRLQSRLKQWGYYTGAVDGSFGEKTRQAVVLFQKRNGLTADGVVGPATAAAIGINLSGNSSGTAVVNSDLQLLAKVVNGEARGESYVGKVAVAAVVLNRVKSGAFPNTVAGVVYQSNAFTCVADGQINLAPSAESLRAAKDAMNGWDPTGGALYYYNPAITTSAWIYSRKVVTVIGQHVFAV